MYKVYKRYKVFYNILKILSSVVLNYNLIIQPMFFMQAYKILFVTCGQCILCMDIHNRVFMY